MRCIRLNLKHPYHMKSPVVACIGYFDGLHLGHQALIKKTNELAKANGCESALITFDPDPWVTIRGDLDVKHISTLRQRINRSVELGIKNIFILEFTKEMSQLPPEVFAKEVLGMCNLKALVCGYDFHYGARGAGNPETLKASGLFDVHIVEEIDEDGEKISSTRISDLIVSGDVHKAMELLGTPFTIEGKVIAGRQVGSKLGFPTANVSFSREYLLPATGVYACYVHVKNHTYKAMVNLGHNPTFNYTNDLSLEAHLLDYSGDLYGSMISIEFMKHLRPEMKFRNIDNLIMQLQQDEHSVRKILK